jgi:hypothetical protein
MSLVPPSSYCQFMILTLYIGPRKLVACQSIKRGRKAEWSYLGSNGVKAIVKMKDRKRRSEEGE